MDFLKQDPKFKIRWQNSNTGAMEIKFSGTPFVLIGNQTYQCHHGKDFNVSKKIYYTEAKTRKVLFEHSHRTFSTKKMECPVTFQTKKILSFPEFSINKNTKWNRTKTSKKLKEFLNGLNNLQPKADSGDKEFPTESATLKYLIKLPKQEHQYHRMGVAAGFIEPLDERVNNYLKGLVRSGCRRIKELQNRAKEFVVNTIFSGEKNSAMFRNRFCPSRRKLENIITIVKLETRFSNIDQEYVQHFNSRWKQLGDTYFSPR